MPESITIPVPGQIARVRQRLYLVDQTTPPPNPRDSTLVSLSCVDDDAQGQRLEVLWEREIDPEIQKGEAWEAIAKRGFDPARIFAAYLKTLRWNCVTATDPRLFQSPFRAGIRLDAYQLEPLRKALLLPRVNLFIADDVGLGKTIEAFALDGFGSFACLQSQTHNLWAYLLSSYLKDDLRYSVSDAFQTFPFPEGFETDLMLEAAGKANYEFRATLMICNDEGLTKTYNCFHDPNEISPDILKLRELHAAMDRAVLDAYGWTDLKPTCDFLLDYEEEEDEEENGGGSSRRRKPWRYRWPDEFRDEVLARLLELNKERAQEEALSGQAAEASSVRSATPGRTGGKKASASRRRRKLTDEDGPGLFSGME